MFAVPADSAVTVHTFDAVAVTAIFTALLLVHTPPASPPVAVSVLVGDDNVCTIVEPMHCTTPGTGSGLTLTCALRLQPFVHV